MQTQAGSWIRAAKQAQKLNILTSVTHENFETNLCATGHNFYSLKHPHLKDWNFYREQPKNYHIYDIGNPPWEKTFDIVIAQSVFGQFQFLYPIAKMMGIPCIRIEHTNSEHLHPQQVEEAKKLSGDLNIFICEHQVKAWGMENSNYRIIPHCVNEYFSPSRKPSQNSHILSVVNDFIGRGKILGFDLWRSLVHGLPHRIRGDSKGLSTACQNINELRNEYQSARVFLNTSFSSPIPSVMLEAAACGIPIVSTETCGIPEYFTHGHDAFLSNEPQELREYLELLLNDGKLADRMGENARKTIEEKCSPRRFVDTWNNIFEELRLK